jgi:hypothetical protein
MVHTQRPGTSRSDASAGDGRVTAWVGWVLFTGIVMFTVGFLNLIQGVIALVRDDFYLVRPNGLVLNIDYTVWGWVLLLSGVLLMFTGYGVTAGQTWARVVGVVIAVANAILNMIFMPAYPIWATMVIALDVLVIYALVVHGREAQRVRR